MTVTIASSAEEIFLSIRETQVLRQRILLLLLSLYKQGYSDFYTNCAWGVPLWSAELLCLLKQTYPDISLHLAIPHEDQVSRWSLSMKKRYLKVKLFADTVTYIALRNDPQSFTKADRFMINNSDLLLYYGKQGFLNYSPQYQSAAVENYAHNKKLPVRYI